MKVVIIGLGSIAKKHINSLRKLDSEVELYALRHSEKSFPSEGVKDFYDIKLIKDINPSFIIISNPTSNHYKTLKEVLEFDIPLFIEKPLFSGIGKKEQDLVSLVLEKKVKTYIACNLRFHKGIRYLKDILKNKKIEEVNIYCGSYLPDWRPGKNFREIYSANKEMGGGVHIDLIHEIDYLYWIFKEPKLIKKVFRSNSSLNISSIDYANYIWNYETFSVNVVLNYYRKDPKRTFEILTDQGTYLLDLLTNTITFKGEVIFESKMSVEEMYVEQMKFFISKIIPGDEEMNTIDEGYKILKYVLE
ncbi:Gfo/Idh/MocA family oxidoreductase [uncultured Tenacibaculum sp.]|uniref:Gfo/Idh/MocA family protein n=1 Tax=uncultured Tenacibaculum sp. TaxID=174713 RepID=UPI00262CAAB5|nr:Gfo/Idh/MocA family oxidoreductase [uncultured Tenacibaculum sp.]